MIEGLGIGFGFALGFWLSGLLCLLGFVILSYFLDWVFGRK
jgi:hypothetical protein